MAEPQPKSDSRALAVQNEFRVELRKMVPQFAAVLPPHIPAERFERVIASAVARTPGIYACDWRSVFNACMYAAEDHLYPDKRQGAIVPFKEDGKPAAVWIPMIAGLRMLIQRSGEVRDFSSQVVYADEYESGAFEHEFGTHHFVRHKRLPWSGDPARREVYGVYSQAWDRRGFEYQHEFMLESEVMAIGRRSRAFKAGPWSDPLYSLEMRRKTVSKRHFKALPHSEHIDRVLHRDDDEEAIAPRPPAPITIRSGAGAALQHFASPTPAAKVEERADRGEEEPPPAEHDGRPEPVEEGKATAKAPEEPVPETPAEYAITFRAYLASAKSAGAIDARWKRDMPARNKLNITPELRDALDEERKAKMAELAK